MDPGPENAPTTAIASFCKRFAWSLRAAQRSVIVPISPMSHTVLVVEDDLNLQTLLNVLLSRGGFSVDFATDGPAGLQKMQDKEYDAIVLDLLVPSRTGLQLLESLTDTRPELVNRVVVVSGAPPATLEKARTFPVHAVIRKPFDIFDLMRTVQSCSAVVCK